MTRYTAGKLAPKLKAGLFALALGGLAATGGQAEQAPVPPAFRQAVAEAASGSDAVAAFYRQNGYQAIWTVPGEAARARRAALIAALEDAPAHGLPDRSAEVQSLLGLLRDARTPRGLGAAEAALSRAFVAYATDLQTGILTPSRVDDGMVRKKKTVDGTAFLHGISSAQPLAYMRSLVPATPQYRALLRAKARLEQTLARGGWGPAVQAGKLEPGDEGPAVVQLRNRLMAMGYLSRSASGRYDAALEEAVRSFQSAHGLAVDGVAGEGTLGELNKPVPERLKAVIVALERERWLPADRGERHVLVNLAGFGTRIIDKGEVTFETRSVIGKNTHDRRSPEFSDEIEHMVINPSWYVPRSIVTKEYLPKLRKNPHAVSQIQVTDRQGRVVNRGSVDFSQYTARNFPFSMKQPPSRGNALGLVKFMFPNKYNIYLHDTPQKNLFGREVRAFSHGCIRLAEPFEFAYALLARQEEDPKAFFHRVLDTGRETRVNLDQKVPVHIIYRTAVVTNDGRAEFRRDVYGRDAKIWAALEQAGVVLAGVQG